MPCIMCLYCEYLGQGETIDDRWYNVLEHEKNCKEK